MPAPLSTFCCSELMPIDKLISHGKLNSSTCPPNSDLTSIYQGVSIPILIALCIVINASGTEFKLQKSLFDAVLPNILPLSAAGQWGFCMLCLPSSKMSASFWLNGYGGGATESSTEMAEFETIYTTVAKAVAFIERTEL